MKHHQFTSGKKGEACANGCGTVLPFDCSLPIYWEGCGKKLKAKKPRPPGYVARYQMRCAAKARWKRAGRPVRAKQRILEVLAICQGCEHYDPGLMPLAIAVVTGPAGCRKCGCPLNDSTNAEINKIAMGTERCPLNPPKWEAEGTAAGGP
jgi:hypothetical protein